MSWGGFKLGGKTAKELNLIMGYDSERPVAPGTRDYLMEIPGKPGAWDFGADREALSFNLVCGVFQKDRASLQQTIRNLASHLFDEHGKPRTMKLIFEYEPNKYYNTRYSGSLPIDRIIGYGQFTLPLTAFDPDAYSTITNDEILWGSEIITFRDDYLMGTTGGQTYDITRSQIVTVTVNGNRSLRPMFVISGRASSVTFQANGKSFSLPSFLNDTWIIDGDKWTVRKNGENALDDMEGDFIKLLSGDNDIEVSGSGMNFTLEIRFRDRYV